MKNKEKKDIPRPYKLVWKGETIEEDLSERDAVYLRHEYNMAYNSTEVKIVPAI